MEFMCSNQMMLIYLSYSVIFILFVIFYRAEKGITPIAKDYEMTRFQLWFMFSSLQLEKFKIKQTELVLFKKYFFWKMTFIVATPFLGSSWVPVINSCN